MLWHRRSSLLTACLLFGTATPAAAAPPAPYAQWINQPVQLTLTDGRFPRGVLSPKSDANGVVLSAERPGISIESRFAWRIVEGLVPLPHCAPPPQPLLPVPDTSLPPAPLPAAPPLPAPPTAAVELTAPPPLDASRLVKSLRIETTMASWDRDSEFDGLLVRVQPLDSQGQVVPVDGNVDVQMVTETRLATGGRSIDRADPFRITERWTAPIHASDFDATGTVVKLPFRRFRPERDFDIAPDALAFARLRLPGAGDFDASTPFVNLRPASRFRDDLQQLQGRRLLPLEGMPHW